MSQAWTTKEAIARRIPQLDAVLTSAAIDATGLTQLISDASGKAQSYLRGLYGPYFAGWGSNPPGEVAGATADIAAFDVAVSCPAGVPYDVLEKKADQALKYFKDLQSGAARLDLPALPIEEQAAAQATTSNLRPVFGPRGPRGGWR
jgi:hypothetical protein